MYHRDAVIHCKGNLESFYQTDFSFMQSWFKVWKNVKCLENLSFSVKKIIPQLTLHLKGERPWPLTTEAMTAHELL